MENNNDNSKKLVMIILSIAALLIGVVTVSYAFINRGSGNNTEVLSGSTISNSVINLTFTRLSQLVNLSYSVDENNLTANRVNIIDNNYDVSKNMSFNVVLNTSGYDYTQDNINTSVICEYSIYYENDTSTSTWKPSSGVTEENPELTIYFVDNDGFNYEVSLDDLFENSESEITLLNTYIIASSDNKLAHKTWIFNYRYYNLPLNQDSAKGKVINGNIVFKSPENGCRVS